MDPSGVGGMGEASKLDTQTDMPLFFTACWQMDSWLYIGRICYTVENREYPQNTPKILFGGFGGPPRKILKKYSPEYST